MSARSMLNPNLAMAWALSGFAFLYAGDLDAAKQRLDRYKQLSPADPFALYLRCRLQLGRVAASAITSRRWR